MDNLDMAKKMMATTPEGTHNLSDPNVAHLVVNHNEVVSSHLLEGLTMDVKETKDGIDAVMKLRDGVVIEKPVHLCFGVMSEKGIQRINMEVEIGKHAAVQILAHCTFPFAEEVKHIMDAKITVGEGATYSYFERHVHGKGGGIEVVPRAKVLLKPNAKFKTEFELLEGRVGIIDIVYETRCMAGSVMEMTARINGRGDDRIRINEIGHLEGKGAVGVLNTRVAVSDDAIAEVKNTLTASAEGARGHVDCKEIVKGRARASAIPVVEVSHPKAHITHEAVLGSVDNKQLETLMSRGLNEEDASDMIIQGLLTA